MILRTNFRFFWRFLKFSDFCEVLDNKITTTSLTHTWHRNSLFVFLPTRLPSSTETTILIRHWNMRRQLKLANMWKFSSILSAEWWAQSRRWMKLMTNGLVDPGRSPTVWRREAIFGDLPAIRRRRHRRYRFRALTSCSNSLSHFRPSFFWCDFRFRLNCFCEL